MGYQVLENQMKSVIHSMKPGTEFTLSDIVSYPPAGLGKILFRDVQSGEIENVVCIESGKGRDKYKKL